MQNVSDDFPGYFLNRRYVRCTVPLWLAVLVHDVNRWPCLEIAPIIEVLPADGKPRPPSRTQVNDSRSCADYVVQGCWSTTHRKLDGQPRAQ